MAPGRRKGGKKETVKKQLKLGDLVLAKVKGYPFWPAKISRSEDWEKEPEPKKYFVHFYGTQEIAFVGPTDIQVFTNEIKSKLLARCQTKSKQFAQALQEICAEFEVLQRNNSGTLGDSTDRSRAAEAPSVDRTGDDRVINDEDGANGETWTQGLLLQCETNDDTKPYVSDDMDDDISPAALSDKKAKLSGGAHADELLSGNRSENFSYMKNEISHDVKSSANREIAWTNGQKSSVMLPGSKRKLEDAVDTSMNGNGSSVQMDSKVEGQIASSGSLKKIFVHALGSDIDAQGHKKLKQLLKLNNGLKERPESAIDPSGMKKRIQLGLANLKPKDNKSIHPKDKLRSGHVRNDATKQMGTSSNDIGNRMAKRSSLPIKREILLALRAQSAKVTSNFSAQVGEVKSRGSLQRDKEKSSFYSQRVEVKSNASTQIGTEKPGTLGQTDKASELSAQTAKAKYEVFTEREAKAEVAGDEVALPLSKCHKRALEAMNDSTALNTGDDAINKDSIERNNDSGARVQVSNLPKRRRVVCFYDDNDEDAKPKTPIHVRPGSNVKAPSLNKRNEAPFKNSANWKHGNYTDIESRTGNSSQSEHSLKESSVQPNDAPLSLTLAKSVKRSDYDLLQSPQKVKIGPAEANPIFSSPRSSYLADPAVKELIEQSKASEALAEVSTVDSHNTAHAGSAEVSSMILESLKSSPNHLGSQNNRPLAPILSGESLGSIPKDTSSMSNHVRLMETLTALDAGIDCRISSLVESKIPGSPMSMKHLIAAAQAKRKQAHSQNLALGNSSSVFTSIIDAQGRTPSSSSAIPCLSGIGIVVPAEVQGSNLVSPSPHCHQISHGNQLDQISHGNQLDAEEIEQRVGSTNRSVGGPLSGGTEAAVARDAFEGMIETLSRAKESIGRATRLAIDCAKYGIANEVVELLIRKLENEPNFHRKVNLFFLMDSITQCSHNQKGVAGASYIPTVQAALPRLLGASAPPGASACENRHQCLKVLRLWLERKIFPESLLKRYMDDIGGSNDNSSAGFSLRHPCRSERAVDDPIREMEGMLLDEYGSNATFQLPKFLSSNLFEDDGEEDEDDLPSSLPKAGAEASRAECACDVGVPASCTVTPSDWRHCILEDVDGELEMEDVDGELEMEDVSGHEKDGKPLLVTGSCEVKVQHHDLDKILELAVDYELPVPPPPHSPPPPLPSSPPPPPPPHPPLPSSSSPPRPPLPPPPLPSLPPPPPLPSLPPPPPIPSLGPPSSLAPQPPLPSKTVIPAQLSVQSRSSLQLAYQPALPPEYCIGTSGNLIGTMALSAHYGPPIDAAVRNELFPHQPSSFALTAVRSTEDPSVFTSRQLEYTHTDMHLNPQLQQNQHFQLTNTTFTQRPMHPCLPASGHFSFTQPPIPQSQSSYPCPYHFLPHPDGRRLFVNEERWPMPSNERNIDNQSSAWMSGRTPHGGPSFGEDEIFQPAHGRPPGNNLGFQLSATNNLLVGAAVSGHGVPPCYHVGQMYPR